MINKILGGYCTTLLPLSAAFLLTTRAFIITYMYVCSAAQFPSCNYVLLPENQLRLAAENFLHFLNVAPSLTRLSW